ncbi:unnamed protein product, partial [marine sediment metagenome]
MDEQIMVIVGSAKRQLRVRNARIVGLMILGIAVLSACGSGGGSSETGDPSALPTPIVLSTSAPDPAAVSEEFLSLWDEGDYSGMYSLLDAPSREGTSETEFIELLEDFRSGTALSSIDYDIASTQIHNPYKASLAVNVTLHSGAAGEIPYLTEMELTRDGADWQVSWENTILHPTLTDDKRM